MDILVLGSDSRSGANRGYGHDSGTARSDTAMIVHLAKGHKKRQRGRHPAGHPDQPPRLRQARRRHRTGRPAGDVQQRLRGRRAGLRGQDGGEADRAADGPLVEVDFTGFKDLVNALGGVPLTTTSAITTPRAT